MLLGMYDYKSRMVGCGCLVNCASLVTVNCNDIDAILNQALTFEKNRPGDEASTMYVR